MVFPFASVPPLTTGALRARWTPPLQAFDANVVKSPRSIASVGNKLRGGSAAGAFRSGLKTAEEEQFVLLDRSADRAAELIPLQGVGRLGGGVVRVEGVVADKFEERAVKIIGSGLRDGIDRGRRVVSVLRRQMRWFRV